MAGDATDIFQEGLSLPPLWLQREGKDQEDVWKIIFANHRTPKVSYGDLMAMVGIGFGIITAQVGAHLISRTGYRIGVPLWKGTIADELGRR